MFRMLATVTVLNLIKIVVFGVGLGLCFSKTPDDIFVDTAFKYLNIRKNFILYSLQINLPNSKSVSKIFDTLLKPQNL